MDMAAPRILLIRRENIGDLVCTTPLLHALRGQLPEAHIEFLTTRYSAAVLDGNPDINALHVYTKAKHREPGESLFALHWQRLRMIWYLRRQNFDWILLPGGAHQSGLRFARLIGSKRILIRGSEDAVGGEHEVEQTCHLLLRMALRFETPPPRVYPDSLKSETLRTELAKQLAGRGISRIVGMHISVRKPSQRWPADRFAALAQRLCEDGKTGVMLLWSPGASDNPQHPGDDDKMRAIVDQAGGLPIAPIPTLHLDQLIAALSLCDGVICADGGAMHVAAGLGKPIVALFGQSGAKRWRPWGVPHIVLQKNSHHVDDISVEEVAAAWEWISAGHS